MASYHRYASSDDIANYPNINEGDCVLETDGDRIYIDSTRTIAAGVNRSSTSGIQIQPDFGDKVVIVPTRNSANDYPGMFLGDQDLGGNNVSRGVITWDTKDGRNIRFRRFDTKGIIFNNSRNIRFTGLYDAANKWGNINYQGRNSDPQFPYDKYGIDVRNEITGGQRLYAGGYMVKHEGACSNIEVDNILLGFGSFAALQSQQPNLADPGGNMANLSHHDLFIVFTQKGEGFYIGNTGYNDTQHSVENYQNYNNLVAFTAAECGQFGKLAGNSFIRNNVFYCASMGQADPFDAGQNGNIQIGGRAGQFIFENNVIIGAGRQLWHIYPDSTGLVFTDRSQPNYIRNNLSLYSGGYRYGFINGSYANSQEYRIENNYFGKNGYTNRQPSTLPEVLFLNFNNINPQVWLNNKYENNGGYPFFSNQGGNITFTGNQEVAINNPSFVRAPFEWNEFHPNLVEHWYSGVQYSNAPSVNMPGVGTINYPAHIVWHMGLERFYRCAGASVSSEPVIGGNGDWTELSWIKGDGSTSYLPPLDLRLVTDSEYDLLGMGLTESGVTPPPPPPPPPSGDQVFAVKGGKKFFIM